MEYGLALRLRRSQRRLLVAASYLGLIGYTTVSLTSKDSWWTLVGLLGILATVAIYTWLLAPSTQKIAGKKEEDLDERQMIVRNRAHHTAYQILGSVVAAALLYPQINHLYLDGQLWAPSITVQNLPSVMVSAIWLIVTLPTSVIAWMELDPETGE
jgi:hypothetical protein